MLFRFTLFIFSILALAVNVSVAAIKKNDDLPVQHTSPAKVLKDEQRLLTIEQVIKSSSWKLISERKDTYPGFDSSAFWSKSSLNSLSQSHEKWILTLQSSRWEEIDWYIHRESGEIEHYKAGNARSVSAGIVSSPLPNITLSLAPGEKVDVYLRCQSLARGSLEVFITNLVSNQGRKIENTYLLTFGALTMTCLLGLIIGLYGKNKGSLAYSISTLCGILVYAGVSGYAKSAGWPFSHFLSMRGSNFFSELGILATLFYLRAFFDLKNATGWPRLVWKTLLIITLFALPLSLLLSYPVFVRFLSLHGIFHGLLTISIAIWAWKQGMNYAKFYVIVWPILWLTLALDSLCSEGLIQLSVNQDHLVTLGLVIFHFGVFLVLAEYTRTQFDNHKHAQQLLLKKEQDLVTNLEKQVSKRTASLQKATTEAIKANKFKDLFLSNIGHEIRTPLIALIGLSQIMVRKGKSANLPPDFRRLLGQIQSGGSHLNLMLTNLMDVGTSNHGKIPLSVSTLNLCKWNQSVKDILSPLASARGITLQWTDNFTASEALNTDQMRLSQIIINLVHNAIKFSPAEGSVYINIKKEEHTISFEILDEGPGLPENPEQLFTAFTRHDTALSNNEHGAGLGLHIVQTTLDLIQGKIIATNRPEGGASFYVTIPSIDLS